jgi:hypothetical protein
MYKYLLVILLSVTCAFTALAQEPDTSVTSKGTVRRTKPSESDTSIRREFAPKRKRKEKIYHPDSLHSPHTAVIHSLIIPGWGQVYNHQWWKVPVIYGALGILGYYIVWNNTNYQEFLTLSKYREHGTPPGLHDPYYNEYQLYFSQPSQAIYDASDYYHRNRDLCILGVLGAWGINAIDAYINAKFIQSYSVDNNLSMRITPGLLNQPAYAFNANGSIIPAIKITFTLK